MSTTALYKALIEAHVSEDTAERAVEGLAYAREVATKTDLAELKTELKQDISELRVELKGDIGALETTITALETTMLRWSIVMTGITIGAVGLIVKL